MKLASKKDLINQLEHLEKLDSKLVISSEKIIFLGPVLTLLQYLQSDCNLQNKIFPITFSACHLIIEIFFSYAF